MAGLTDTIPVPTEITLHQGTRVLTAIEGVGNYAVKLVFNDGHDSGLYSWDVLYRLGQEQERLWADYLARLGAAGASRDIDLSLITAKPGNSCSKH